MGKPSEEHVTYRYDDDGKPFKVYIRKCRNCRYWFGTPWYRDEWCCPGCKDAEKRREQRELKRWPKARKVER